MSDYVRRDDVVDRLEKIFLLQADTARAIVEEIPSADVVSRDLCEMFKHLAVIREPKRGRWIYTIYESEETAEFYVEAVCSACKEYKESFAKWLYDDGYRVDHNYCPHCGAEMWSVTDDVL